MARGLRLWAFTESRGCFEKVGGLFRPRQGWMRWPWRCPLSLQLLLAAPLCPPTSLSWVVAASYRARGRGTAPSREDGPDSVTPALLAAAEEDRGSPMGIDVL